MIDADHGDSHIIDFCSVDKGAGTVVYPTTERSYRRFLIDTGPESRTLYSMINIFKTYGQPSFKPTATGVVETAAFGDEARVQLVESFFNTTALYHELPATVPKFHLSLRFDPSTLPPSFYVTCDEILPASVTPSVTLGDTSWVDRMKSAGFKIQYKFITQPMRTVRTAPPTDLAVPAPVTRRLRSRHSFAYQVIKSSDVASTYNAVLVTCVVSLKRFVASNNTTANTWVGVEMKDPSVARKFIFRAVYGLTFARRTVPTDIAILGVPVPPVVLTGALSSVRDFVRIRDEIKKLPVIPAVGTVPAHTLITPVEVKAIKKQFVIDEKYFSFNIMGPNRRLYDSLIESSMVALYKAKTQTAAAPVGNYDITNRASIISLFTRYKVLIDDTKVPVFRMLFTGDAYDRQCNIQNTVQGFLETKVITNVGVLKVPHHGSARTTEAGFYNAIRAQVYLVAAQQSKHGSPSLSMLQAIARSFSQTPASFVVGTRPYLLFFSDPASLDDIDTLHSNVYRLLHGPYKPNRDATTGKTIYNYRCFRLRKSFSANAVAGRILLGGDTNDELTVQFTSTANDLDPDMTKDWVEMV
ncbi:hypothetical protein MMC17_003387 [Xylographa soralifera]|nr:hypothetical protein [Xylographa soralifera]